MEKMILWDLIKRKYINIGYITKLQSFAFYLDDVNGVWNFKWSLKSDGQPIELVFQNVTSIKVDNFENEINLGHIQITDRKNEGWEIRYELNDIEDSRISFFFNDLII